MTKIKQIPINKIAEYFNSDEVTAEKYISENLLVARGVNAARFKYSFLNQPIILPEMRILMVKEGYANPNINLMPQEFREHDVIYVGKNSIVNIPEDFRLIGYGISMSDELFHLAVGAEIPKSFDGHLRNFKVHLNQSDWEHLNNLHLTLYNQLNSNGSTMATLRLIAAFLWQADYLFGKSEDYADKSHSREQRLLSQFIQLIDRYAPAEHNIDFYASRLCLSPRYMSTIIKKVSGKAAKEWIDEALINKIKVELKYTDKSINSIAEEMNFPNPSFFTKYFKQLTATTPLRYRAMQ